MDLLCIMFMSTFFIASFFVYFSKNPIYYIRLFILFLGYAVLFLFIILMLKSIIQDVNCFLIDPIENLYIFGTFLYNFYFDGVILAGLILLITVLSWITLTLNAKQELNISALKIKILWILC